MKADRNLLLHVLLTLAMPGTQAAMAVEVCLLPNQSGNGKFGATFAISDAGLESARAVNDAVVKNGTLVSVTFWGGYLDAAFMPCSPGTDDFTVKLFRDEEGMVGRESDSFAIGPANRMATGSMIPFPKTAMETPEYVFTFQFMPTDDAEWISIFNDGSTTGCFFVWETAPPGSQGDGLSAATSDLTSWEATPVDFAVCVEAPGISFVPALSEWGLLTTALGLLVAGSLVVSRAGPGIRPVI
ncbi:MAG: hypothetical protein ACYTHJ_04370 [Planctomycetota bacterium]